MDMIAWVYRHLMDIALIGWIIVSLVSLWLAQKNRDSFNLLDFVCDPPGKASLDKLIRLGTWVFTSWIIAEFVRQGKLTESFFMAYLATWAGLAAVKAGADAYTMAKQQPQPATHVTNVNQPGGQQP